MTDHIYLVSREDEQIRLDKLLTAVNKRHARHQIQTWIKDKRVTVNGTIKKANYRCKKGDELRWSIPEEHPKIIKAEQLSLPILYEDNHLLVINKPKGMLVHPTEKQYSGTLVNGLKYYSTNLSTISGENRPGIVHRLDKDTAGALIVAKDNDTHLHLKEQFKRREVIRIYETIVHGEMKQHERIVRAPIGRNPNNRLKRMVIETGKEAETHFTVLGTYRRFTHVQCRLITGRTHQIRVHLSYINHPIVGDSLYGKKQKPTIQGQALFAKTIEFIHPQTKEAMRFTAEEPEDFNELLQRIKKIT